MSENPLKFTRRTRRGIGRKKELMFTVLSTKLWVADHWLFEQERIRKHVKAAVLLRDIVHQWAMKKRLAPDAPSTVEETATIALLREIKKEMVETQSEIRALKQQVSEMAQSHCDWLELNDHQLSEVIALGRAQYNVSGQGFSVLWATVELLRRYLVRPFLSNGPHHDREAYALTGIEVQDLRVQGLEMVNAMSDQFQFPQPVETVLVNPPKKS